VGEVASNGRSLHAGVPEPQTVFALSSGQPPAAIAIVRISGPSARDALAALCSVEIEPRRPRLADLRFAGELLDRALILFFPGPNSATGDDLAELHLHGGRAVVAAVEAALASLPDLRRAEPGEFTRRAFANGRLDLAEAEGLADLLAAETEAQRRSAVLLANGSLSRETAEWTSILLRLAAAVEAVLDFSDEGDVDEGLPPQWHRDLALLTDSLGSALQRPSAERLRDGIRVVLAGPPNAGKSSLFNALAGRKAAIIHEIPGTTRDLLEAPVAIGGLPFLLIDTAGLRETGDAVEAIGVDRARDAAAVADILLWLGAPEDAPPHDNLLRVQSMIDVRTPSPAADFGVSATTGQGLSALVEHLRRMGQSMLSTGGEAALHRRHREALEEALTSLTAAQGDQDLLLAAEHLRIARQALDRVTGRAGVEDMLDTLFGRFCIGK
jgi:tRNA modification GTPase